VPTGKDILRDFVKQGMAGGASKSGNSLRPFTEQSAASVANCLRPVIQRTMNGGAENGMV
jgi:hypothetical protein